MALIFKMVSQPEYRLLEHEKYQSEGKMEYRTEKAREMVQAGETAYHTWMKDSKSPRPAISN